jgi:hypothetical protein
MKAKDAPLGIPGTESASAKYAVPWVGRHRYAIMNPARAVLSAGCREGGGIPRSGPMFPTLELPWIPPVALPSDRRRVKLFRTAFERRSRTVVR